MKGKAAELLKFRRALVFCAHPDDEIIGAGGTIAKLAAQGADVKIVMFTEGETGYTRNDLKGKIGRIRRVESQNADKILGVKERITMSKPCQGVAPDVKSYQECVGLIRKYKPDVIFTHYHRDSHRDHRTISRLIDEARWKASENILSDLGKVWYTQYLFFFEVFQLFSNPSMVVDITDTMDKKIKAMKTQKSQFEIYPDMLEYIKGLAKARGFLRGTKYAEAFLASNTLPVLG